MKTKSNYKDLDRQITDILSCKPLPESDVIDIC
jgi:hypothetical protein